MKTVDEKKNEKYSQDWDSDEEKKTIILSPTRWRIIMGRVRAGDRTLYARGSKKEK